ncbi:carboxypeptidase-like regulatory domain-containing protein [Sphingomonas sp. Ant20]|uniref:carboxypeptidase-like regulatory domain-containing protein n=1 Tax=Sphingomonas sp. Ant20 TaxID=104605 RepID=UPI00053667C8|nr:carboxypeptidase-like regulatory domain-containing protein [Sphingomonas sp. Ant20]KHA62703.1 hypothetical protein NI18_21840 [Sphingomonas sp. Ant20]
MNKTILRTALAAMTALSSGAMLLPAPAMAQVGQASLRGTLTAPADNPVVEVTAVEVATGIRRSVQADANGSYNFASLRAGTYRLEIKQRSGTRNSDTFTLRVGQTPGSTSICAPRRRRPPPRSRHRANNRQRALPPAPKEPALRPPKPRQRPAAAATSSSPATASARSMAVRSGSTSPRG